jgi:nitroreductase
MNKLVILGIVILFGSLAFTPLTSAAPLPPPQAISMNFEQTVFRRMSIREFTNQSIADQDLSTILYNAMGQRSDGSRTNAGHNGTYSTVLYVLKTDAAYTYAPENHSLVLYKPGDWRYIVGYQYPTAAVVLGLCYNTTQANANEGGFEIGQVCQNIAFSLDALDLGGVVTGGLPPAIDNMGIPASQQGLIVMPIGHPLHPYDFKDRPLWFSLRPAPVENAMNLTEVLLRRNETSTFSGILTRQQQGQLVWSAYGYSPYIDRSNQDLNKIQRHRTVPSAHGYYPLVFYAVTPKGVYRYQPNLLTSIGQYSLDYIGLPVLTYLQRIQSGDHRSELAAASSLPALDIAPLTLVAVLDSAKTHGAGDNYTQFWHLEAGAALHTAMLEAAALGLPTAQVTPTDPAAIATLLKCTAGQTPIALLAIEGHC